MSNIATPAQHISELNRLITSAENLRNALAAHASTVNAYCERIGPDFALISARHSDTAIRNMREELAVTMADALRCRCDLCHSTSPLCKE
jgi:hypothetical protein